MGTVFNAGAFRASLPFAAVVFALGACNPAQTDVVEHGTIKLEFRRGDGVGDNPFAGTSVIQVRLNYQTCLIDFYKANPNYALNGPEGSLAFGTADDGGEAWKDRLCGFGNVDCDVISFRQQLDDNQGNWLQVLYSVSGAIENRTLHFGPVPLPGLAACKGVDGPIVRVADDGAVRGLDGVPPDGDVLWNLQKFDPGIAEPNQGASIGIDAEPAN